ncbi:unnamed protein product [Calicophoron daubneyi]|uniref:Uncharacterized protein n=1 Tax=Calicophoron daubneyi TaxID=300641 RepID=A0AAV2TSN5_CALDB
MPIILVEYAIGRFTQNSAPVAFMKFYGKRFCWVGGWLSTTVLFLSGYYPVVVGWCLYYLFISVTFGSLPGDEEAGMAVFNDFVRDSYWPVFTQFLAIFLSGIFLFGGIRWIEKANMVLVPLLLAIVIFTFGWSLTRDYAEVGITFLFTPTWRVMKKYVGRKRVLLKLYLNLQIPEESFAIPGLWIAAAGQNAFDTGAGMSVLMTYAAFTGRSASITKYSIFIPLVNNLLLEVWKYRLRRPKLVANEKLLCLDHDFLYGVLYAHYDESNCHKIRYPENYAENRSWQHRANIYLCRLMPNVFIMSRNYSAIRIPVLFSKVGILGRILCALFFLCLTFAGVSSLLSAIQAYVFTIKEMGVPHRIAVSVALVLTFLIGLPSALSLEFLDNQDNTWGYALIISGLIMASVSIIYGPIRFRRVLVNEYGTNDWNVPIIWIPIITFVVPIIGIALIIWWIYDYVRMNSYWYHLTLESVTSTLLEWLIVIILLLGTNMIVYYCRREFYTKPRNVGCDPYKPSTYEDPRKFKLEDVKVTTNGISDANSAEH